MVRNHSVKPQAIIFDIGRVIVRLNLDRAFAPLAASLDNSRKPGAPQTQLNPQQIWTAIQSDARWRDWQEGRMTPREWHGHITEWLKLSLGFADFCAAWNSVLDPTPILNDKVFEFLGRSFRLALLSNTDPVHVEYMERNFSFVRHFPVRVYSCSVGLRKPDKGIYQAALDAVGVSANGALYIDDVAEFVDAARQIGLDAIQFHGPSQLARELSVRGIHLL